MLIQNCGKKNVGNIRAINNILRNYIKLKKKNYVNMKQVYNKIIFV